MKKELVRYAIFFLLLALLVVGGLVFWNSRPVPENPGQAIDAAQIQYPPLPKIKNALDFSVAVARFERDSEGKWESALVDRLWTLTPLEGSEHAFEVLRLLRPVAVSGIEARATLPPGLAEARQVLAATGADLLLWGSLGGRPEAPQIFLHWISAHEGPEQAGEGCGEAEGHTLSFVDSTQALNVASALADLQAIEYARDHFGHAPHPERVREIATLLDEARRSGLAGTTTQAARDTLALLWADAERLLVDAGVGNPEAVYKVLSEILERNPARAGAPQDARLLQRVGEMAFRASRMQRTTDLQTQAVTLLSRARDLQDAACNPYRRAEITYLLGLVLYDAGLRSQDAEKLRASIEALLEAQELRAGQATVAAREENQLMLGLAKLAYADFHPSGDSFREALEAVDPLAAKFEAADALAVVRDQAPDTALRWAIAQNARSRALVGKGALQADAEQVCNGLGAGLAAWEVFHGLQSPQEISAMRNVDHILQVLDKDIFEAGTADACARRFAEPIDQLRHALPK